MCTLKAQLLVLVVVGFGFDQANPMQEWTSTIVYAPMLPQKYMGFVVSFQVAERDGYTSPS
jgi:hypothetical protein